MGEKEGRGKEGEKRREGEREGMYFVVSWEMGSRLGGTLVFCVWKRGGSLNYGCIAHDHPEVKGICQLIPNPDK